MGTSALMGTLYGMGTSALPQLQRRRDSACEDDGAAQAREEARGLAWLVTVSLLVKVMVRRRVRVGVREGETGLRFGFGG